MFEVMRLYELAFNVTPKEQHARAQLAYIPEAQRMRPRPGRPYATRIPWRVVVRLCAVWEVDPHFMKQPIRVLAGVFARRRGLDVLG